MREDCTTYALTVLVLGYALQIALGLAVGYTDSSLFPHLTFCIFHANVFHLAANALTLCLLRPAGRDLLSGYIISLLASFVAVTAAPTVGFSGALYAMIGMRTTLFRGRFTFPKAWFAGFLLAGLFLPHVNGLLHVLCFVAGAAVQLYRRTADDYARAN